MASTFIVTDRVSADIRPGGFVRLKFADDPHTVHIEGLTTLSLHRLVKAINGAFPDAEAHLIGEPEGAA